MEFTPLTAKAGAKPSLWTENEFQQAVGQYMQQLSVLATADGEGLTVEVPYAESSSLCVLVGDVSHPRIGNGLLLLQSFPIEAASALEGRKLALELNAEALDSRPFGYGLGSYVSRDNLIHFTGFIPNVGYMNGLLPNLFFACAERAHAMAARFSER